jgi:hypothetical protein
MDTDFRVGRTGLGGRTAFSNNQFFLIDAYLLVFQDIFESQSPYDRRRKIPNGLRLVKLRDEQSPLSRDGRNGMQALFTEIFDAIGHDKSDSSFNISHITRHFAQGTITLQRYEKWVGFLRVCFL